jgi:excisionase family DNA binding protein
MPCIQKDNPLELPTYDPEEESYTTKQLAKLLGVSIHTLAKWRRQGNSPRYAVIGYRSRRYPKAEVIKYIQERTRASTSATRNYDLHP